MCRFLISCGALEGKLFDSTSQSANTIMSKTAIITGATGLLGRQVVKAFEKRDWDVKGTGLTRANPPKILKLDLGSEPEVTKILEETK